MAVSSVKADVQARLEEAAELLRESDGWGPPSPGLYDPEALLGRIFSRWQYLVAGLAAAVLAAAVYLVTLPRSYVAEALVAPVQSRTDVQFEPKIKTVSDTVSNGNQATVGALTPERRQALADLVTNTQIESSVIQQLKGKLNEAELAPGKLILRVKAALKPRSELISIQVQAPTAADALALTNAWAAAYVSQANKVYGNGITDLESLVQQRNDAQGQYESDEAALTAAQKENRAAELDRQIQDRLHRVALLQSPYQAGAFGGVATSDKTAPAIDAATARNDYRLAAVRTLDDLAQIMRRLDDTKQTAQTLLNASGGGASDAVAIALLKAQLVSIQGSLPSQIQFQIAAGGGDSKAELTSLISSITQAREAVAREFDSRRAAYEAQRTGELSQLEQEVRALTSQREAADAELKQLQLKRDLSWNTYSALANKVQEQQVATATTGREVELASSASYARPVSRRAPQTLGLAGIAGLVVGAIAALLPLGRKGLSHVDG